MASFERDTPFADRGLPLPDWIACRVLDAPSVPSPGSP
jgi:hypothetical protein